MWGSLFSCQKICQILWVSFVKSNGHPWYPLIRGHLSNCQYHCNLLSVAPIPSAELFWEVLDYSMIRCVCLSNSNGRLRFLFSLFYVTVISVVTRWIFDSLVIMLAQTTIISQKIGNSVVNCTVRLKIPWSIENCGLCSSVLQMCVFDKVYLVCTMYCILLCVLFLSVLNSYTPF